MIVNIPVKNKTRQLITAITYAIIVHIKKQKSYSSIELLLPLLLFLFIDAQFRHRSLSSLEFQKLNGNRDFLIIPVKRRLPSSRIAVESAAHTPYKPISYVTIIVQSTSRLSNIDVILQCL